jgi:cellulose synthase/poly-beta-1,6-N-acetylglucosamine synthase-like glycosyltransferase
VIGGSYPKDRLEILVVDNASTTDETRIVVEEFREVVQIRYMFEGKSGSASARNRALPEIRTELVVFTDDDTRMDVHWLIEIVRGFWSDERADVVTGLLLPSSLETPAQVWFEEYGGFSRGFARRVFDVKECWPLNERLFPFSAGLFGTGNNMAFRTNMLRDIGGFDPALGNGTPALGGVDSEVLLRSILLGYRLVYQPTAIVYHEHRRDYESLKRQVFWYGTGLSAYLCKTLWNNPKLIPLFLRLLPQGLVFEADPRSKKNSHKSEKYPLALTVAEWRGMAYGPVAYARSRRAYGPHAAPKAVPQATRRPPHAT